MKKKLGAVRFICVLFLMILHVYGLQSSRFLDKKQSSENQVKIIKPNFFDRSNQVYRNFPLSKITLGTSINSYPINHMTTYNQSENLLPWLSKDYENEVMINKINTILSNAALHHVPTKLSKDYENKVMINKINTMLSNAALHRVPTFYKNKNYIYLLGFNHLFFLKQNLSDPFHKLFKLGYHSTIDAHR